MKLRFLHAVVPDVPVPAPPQVEPTALPAVNAEPIGVLPGPWVNPEISTYSTAARTTVIATSKMVAMIGDTARFRAFLQLRLFVSQTFIRFVLRGPEDP